MTTKTIFKILILTVTTALLSCSQPTVTPTATPISDSLSYPKVEAGKAGSVFPTAKPAGTVTYDIAPLKAAVSSNLISLTINTNTGEVTVTATNTAGTYQVTATVGGGGSYTARFYVAIMVRNSQDITNEIEGANTGLAMWGAAGDYNYIDTSLVTDMSYLFAVDYRLGGFYRFGIRFNVKPFTGDISLWDVEQVTNMKYMFSGSDFNGDVSLWDVDQVTDMRNMFHSATSFNGDISGWDVDNVTDMRRMFSAALVFNQDLNSWDVRMVTDMRLMFHSATSFNRDLNDWDVGNVANMTDMFNGATVFNRDISGWAVDQVTDMEGMFKGATTFTQDLEPWGDHLKGRTVSMTDMFTNSGVTSPPSWYTQ